MSDDIRKISENNQNDQSIPSSQDNIKHHLTGMYESWFLDYASYVILERAVPHINDGLKPVQRRILHSMKRMDDGRYNKVANIVGHTMQFHPHGDASIGDALIQLGQKDYLVDCQGNWGNILTGDRAAAPRYIEARLSKFALEVVFNPKTTEWQKSYDGRNKEPITLPIKFPLLLVQGAEGIAVGLSSKILPHNFNDLCDAAIKHLNGKKFELYPDFQTGGYIDVSRYNDGERGGNVKVRAKINKIDNRTLSITEIPFGKTTTSVIDSIIKAVDKGKIKIRKVDDNTSANVEIIVHLPAGVSSDKTIDALYAFTDCEISISPNCCVIEDNKPHFLTVSDVLKKSVENTLSLLQQELEIRKSELLENLQLASLEKIFIEERIYKDKEFENAKNMDIACKHIDKRLIPFYPQLIRDVTKEDILKLMEIKMGRILKFNTDKADDAIAKMQAEIAEINKELSNMIAYTSRWFSMLQKKYGKDHPRLTEIRSFDNIEITKVVEANEKLYFNAEEGFMGTDLKSGDFISNCSTFDDIIIFYKSGVYMITPVADKKFIGKDVIHIDVFQKDDERTIYNVVYRDGKDGGIHYIKRFFVTSVIRDKEYDVTQGTPGSEIVYFSANPNGEAEIIHVALKIRRSDRKRIRKTEFDEDFSNIAIKGKQAKGNILTKRNVKKITLKEQGGSTLGGVDIWFDPDVQKLNHDERGIYLGEFTDEDRILVITEKGNFYTCSYDITTHFVGEIKHIEKLDEEKVWTAVLIDANNKNFPYIKRFSFEDVSKKESYLGGNDKSKELLLTENPHPIFRVTFGGPDKDREAITIDAVKFIDKKGFGAKGKRLSTYEINTVVDINPPSEDDDNDLDDQDEETEDSSILEQDMTSSEKDEDSTNEQKGKDRKDGQMELF